MSNETQIEERLIPVRFQRTDAAVPLEAVIPIMVTGLGDPVSCAACGREPHQHDNWNLHLEYFVEDRTVTASILCPACEGELG